MTEELEIEDPSGDLTVMYDENDEDGGEDESPEHVKKSGVSLAKKKQVRHILPSKEANEFRERFISSWRNEENVDLKVYQVPKKT